MSAAAEGGTAYRRRRWTLAAAVAVAAAAAAQAPPEPAAPPDAPVPIEFEGSAAVSWVLVPVVVRDEGGVVRELEAADFRLRVDGREVPIASFDAGSDAPTSLVVLQDLSGSMAVGGKLAASREVMAILLERFGPYDEMAIATFASGRIRVEVPFTGDREALAEAVAAWEGYGTTALHDAVAWLPDIQAGGRGGKRAALLVTDGVDNASVLGAATARDLVRQAELPVYVLALHGRHLGPATATDDDVVLASVVLRQLARGTGGRYHGVEDPDELKEAILDLVEDLRWEVVLGFPSRPDGPVADHAIEVELAGGKGRRGWEVRARRHYRGTAPLTGGR